MGGGARLQLLEPVLDDVDLGLWFLLDHDEVLSVGRNVVVRASRILRSVERSLEEERWLSRAERRLGINGDRHHLVAIAVEDLAARFAPRSAGDRSRPAICPRR